MIISINQPAYLPWLGYFDRIAKSDIHVVLDHVQFEKNSYVNRNKIRTVNGESLLTVPVSTKGKFNTLEINKLLIAGDGKWQKKHWLTLKQNYAKSKKFGLYEEYFEQLYKQPWKHLAKLLRVSTEYILSCLEISTPIIYSSEMSVSGAKSDLVLNICKQLNADVYLSGPYGRDYLKQERFFSEGIDIKFQDYQHPVYAQLYEDFIPNMSIVDLLFNHGEKALNILSNE